MKKLTQGLNALSHKWLLKIKVRTVDTDSVVILIGMQLHYPEIE